MQKTTHACEGYDVHHPRLGPDGAAGRTGAGVRGADGSWMLELARGTEGGFMIAYERVGGIVRVTGQAVLHHPSGYVLQPVTVVMREEDAGSCGPKSLAS